MDLDGVLDICEKCRKNPEIAHVTQTASACASALSQLQKTIISSISSEESRLIRVGCSVFMHYPPHFPSEYSCLRLL